jgi:hypothetical protein
MLEHVCNLGTVVDARNTAARAEDQARENLSAAVHGPGETGVTSIGVASAKPRSAEGRAGSADATGLEVVLQPNGWKWRDNLPPCEAKDPYVTIRTTGTSTLLQLRPFPTRYL